MRVFTVAMVWTLAGCSGGQPPLPDLLQMTPSSGWADVPNPVTVEGTFYLDVSVSYVARQNSRLGTTFGLSLGATPLTGVAYSSRTQLLGTVPAGLSPGSYDLTLVDPLGRTTALVGAYTVLPAGAVACTTITDCVDPCYSVATGCTNGLCVFGAPDKDSDVDGFVDEACGGTDCNDNCFDCAPGKPESVADGVDQNCDGVDDCYRDGDGDGFGDAATIIAGDDLDCTNSVGESADNTDCDDTCGVCYLGAAELCDSFDNDCSAATLDGSAEPTLGDPCDGPDSDQCREGVWFCNGTLQCDDATADSLEGPFGDPTCTDTNDNDCDGATDDLDSDCRCDDLDGDGLCGLADCNDTIPTCGADCTANTDSGCETLVVPDCVELYCGSDIATCGPGNDCLLVSNGTELNSAISTANGTGVLDHILVTDSFSTSSGFSSFSSNSGVTVRQARGTVIQAAGTGTLFRLESQNNVLDGLNIEGGSTGTVVFISANTNTVQNTVIDGFVDAGIFTDDEAADNVVVFNNIVRGGTGSPAEDRAALRMGRNFNAEVVGNLIVDNSMDAIQLFRNEGGTFIDHNTIANNGRDGIRQTPTGDPSVNLCIRNNTITGNGGVAFRVEDEVTFNTSAACVGALAAGPIYGNNETGNLGGSCGGVCGGCGCLPAGTFWEFNLDPAFTSTTWPTDDYYCLGEAVLIDGGSDLGRDLNGTAAGNFESTGPDIGGRESGAEGCP